jgi:signal transduction histidine kinase
LHFDIQAAISRRELERENRSLMLSLRDANTRLEERIAERTRELAKTNEELNHISQFRADVLKILGHELHTPLAILQGYLQLAASATGRESGAYLEQMEQSLVRLERIARKALLLDKVTENSQIPIMPERVAPAGLCRKVIGRLEPLIRARAIQFDLTVARPVPDCDWDPGRIEHIVEELLINAVRATPNGGTVKVQLDTGPGTVLIRVIDEGTGMTEAEHGRVFEPFVTLGAPDHHTSGQFDFRAQGLGIGLSTARMLAEMHGGSLVSVPNPSGQGCIFTLTLCQRTEPAPAAPAARPTPFAGDVERAPDKPAAAP